MFRARRQAEFSTWQAPDSGLTIVYSETAMRLIVDRVTAALHSIPGRGVEAGGVLFGSADHGEVRITVSRPIYCSHAHGPSWTLTEEEESNLAAAVEEFGDDPELSGLIPVGLYLSHTRGGLALTDEEAARFRRYFPAAHHVALLIIPESGKPARAGFFVRDGDGVLNAEACAGEFVAGYGSETGIYNLPDGSAGTRGNGHARVESPVPEPPAVVPERAWPHAVPPDEILDRPRESRFHWKLSYGLCVLAAGIGGGILLWTMPREQARAGTSIGLRLAERNGMLMATWNGKAERIEKLDSATLEISDGSLRRVILNRELIESGQWPLVTQSRAVSIKFRSARGSEVIDSARFAGGEAAPATVPASAVEPVEDVELNKLREGVRARQQQLQVRLEENETLTRRVETLREMIRLRLSNSSAPVPKPSAPTPVPPAAQPVPAAKQQTPEPLAPPPSPGPTTASSTVPAQTIPQVRPPTQPERPAPQFTERATPPRPAPPPVQAAKPPAYSGPTSGRMIWTGALSPGGSLVIDGRRASTGSLVGGLPAVPIRIGAYPMELGAGGFTVWSGNSRHARGNVVEEPSGGNGWQRTSYRYDPRKAAEIVVVEPPSGANNWGKMILRGGGSTINALLIEWEVVQP